jgi:MoxR-like ATPase
MKTNPKAALDLQRFRLEPIIQEIGRVIFGKAEQIRLALTCLFAKGHLLIEDIPGIGKTTLAKVLSKSLGLDFHRIQCTSDMLPGDILGVSVFERKTSAFIFHPGPIFTQVLLADEINRATPKTQSALLEAMEERQVTVEGETRKLARPFFVIATQNPIEQSGTYPLPESQLDRFLMRIRIGYPHREAEKRLLQMGGTRGILESIPAGLSSEEVILLQHHVEAVYVSEALLAYVQDLLEFTRNSQHFHLGLSPRAGMNLLAATRAWAYLNGRDFALPEDVQTVMPCVIGHRLHSREERREFPPDDLDKLLRQVAVP